MQQSDDEDLHARFAELRNEDRAHAPAFDALWTRAQLSARRAARPRALRVALIAAAAGVVLTVGMLLQQSRTRDRRRTGSATAATISNWRSPTAGLLHAPGGALLAPPAIFSSILDGATGATVEPQGDGL